MYFDRVITPQLIYTVEVLNGRCILRVYLRENENKCICKKYYQGQDATKVTYFMYKVRQKYNQFTGRRKMKKTINK